MVKFNLLSMLGQAIQLSLSSIAPSPLATMKSSLFHFRALAILRASFDAKCLSSLGHYHCKFWSRSWQCKRVPRVINYSPLWVYLTKQNLSSSLIIIAFSDTAEETIYLSYLSGKDKVTNYQMYLKQVEPLIYIQ